MDLPPPPLLKRSYIYKGITPEILFICSKIKVSLDINPIVYGVIPKKAFLLSLRIYRMTISLYLSNIITLNWLTNRYNTFIFLRMYSESVILQFRPFSLTTIHHQDLLVRPVPWSSLICFILMKFQQYPRNCNLYILNMVVVSVVVSNRSITLMVAIMHQQWQ